MTSQATPPAGTNPGPTPASRLFIIGLLVALVGMAFAGVGLYDAARDWPEATPGNDALVWGAVIGVCGALAMGIAIAMTIEKVEELHRQLVSGPQRDRPGSSRQW